MQWRPDQKYLIHQNATIGEPAIETMARWWGVCELEIYDEVMKIKTAFMKQEHKHEMKSIKRYHTGTEHLIPSKLKAPAGKRAFSMPPPDEDRPVKPVTRPKAQYSNRSFVDEVLGETG